MQRNFVVDLWDFQIDIVVILISVEPTPTHF